MKVVGFISIDNGLPLKANCLNQTIDIKINVFKGRLLTPKLPKNYKNNSDNIRKCLNQPESIINFNETTDWGIPISWPDGDSNVTRFKIEIDIQNDNNIEKVKEKLSVETEKWINRFLENLFAIGYNYEGRKNHDLNKYINNFDYYVKNEEKEKSENFKYIGHETIKIIISESESIDLKNLQKVIDATSDNKTLKLEYKLLKEADKALNEKEYRKSILDIATALEICLTNVLKENLAVKNEELRKKILKLNNSISKKRGLLKILGIELPMSSNNYQTEVEKLRNEAVHAGSIPEEEQIKKAYKIVSITIDNFIKNKFENNKNMP